MIDGINNSLPVARPLQSASGGSSQKINGANFEEMLKTEIGEVSKLQQDASHAVQALANAETEDMAGVMTAVEKADLAFKTLLAIRAKLMDAYEEIKNMPM